VIVVEGLYTSTEIRVPAAFCLGLVEGSPLASAAHVGRAPSKQQYRSVSHVSGQDVVAGAAKALKAVLADRQAKPAR
jgi:hypothetical protein